MHPKRNKRLLSVPENWFAAFLFSFKLFTVGMAVWLLVWHVWLSESPDTSDFAVFDYASIASTMSHLYFVVAGVLVIGGLIQQFKYSPRAGLWSIGFSALALGIGIVLMNWFGSYHDYDNAYGPPSVLAFQSPNAAAVLSVPSFQA